MQDIFILLALVGALVLDPWDDDLILTHPTNYLVNCAKELLIRLSGLLQRRLRYILLLLGSPFVLFFLLQMELSQAMMEEPDDMLPKTDYGTPLPPSTKARMNLFHSWSCLCFHVPIICTLLRFIVKASVAFTFRFVGFTYFWPHVLLVM